MARQGHRSGPWRCFLVSDAPTLAEQISDFASEIENSSLPPEIVESVKMRVLDTMGIAIAAAPLETSRAVRRWVVNQHASGIVNAIGVESTVPANLAAFVNGALAHSLDYDDTHLPSILHPSATVVPVALAAAQEAGSDGESLIKAIAVGLEVAVRLGMAGYDPEEGNSLFFEHGQHATSICGAMGGAVSAAMLKGNKNQIVHVMGIAASMASGIIESNRTGGTIKRLHCGWAANSAISAAGLAELGITGPPTVLEGRFGFFEAWLHGNFDGSVIVDGLGKNWSIEDIFFKPYPANHFTHAAIDAGAALRESGISVDRISKLTLGVPAPVIRTIGEPIEVKRNPETGYMAQFSGPYAVTVGLLGGGGLGASLADFTDELAHDPLRRALMAKVEVVPTEKCTEIFPHQFPAILTAELTNGEVHTREILTNRGGPQRPLSFAEIQRKFADNAQSGLKPDQIEQFSESCRTLDTCSDIGDITAPLAQVDNNLDRA